MMDKGLYFESTMLPPQALFDLILFGNFWFGSSSEDFVTWAENNISSVLRIRKTEKTMFFRVSPFQPDK